MALVRVVIPTYNRASLVREALNSVLAQTLADFDIVVTDDGSTDETPATLQEFTALDSRVRFCRIAHAGPSQARNAAIGAGGTYKYVAFLDSDDLWLPQHLERAVSVLEREPQIAVFFAKSDVKGSAGDWTTEEVHDWMKKFERWTSCAVRGPEDNLYFYDAPTWIKSILLSKAFTPLTTSVVRREAIKRAEWFRPELQVCEDREFFLFIATSGYASIFDNVLHAFKRRLGDNLSGSKNFTSREVLHRAEAVLDYYKLKLRYCGQREEYDHIRREIETQCYILGQWNSEVGDLKVARRFYRQALRYRISSRIVKGLFLSSLPLLIYSMFRDLKVISRLS